MAATAGCDTPGYVCWVPQVSFLGRQQSTSVLVKAASNFGSSRSFVFATDPNASNHGTPPGSPRGSGGGGANAAAGGGDTRQGGAGLSRFGSSGAGGLGPSNFAGLKGMISGPGGSGSQLSRGGSGGGPPAAAAAGGGLARSGSASSSRGGSGHNLFELLQKGGKQGGSGGGNAGGAGAGGANLSMQVVAVMNAKFAGQRKG
jgi:hypothetical protein